MKRKTVVLLMICLCLTVALSGCFENGNSENTPTEEPTAAPTAEPTATPTAAPTAEPTATPTAEPTATPTAEPTATPTDAPTAEPTAAPTAEPTATPTAEPTATPTAEPTATPTATPTAEPTATPTAEPTATPTATPTAKPTATPTATPTPKPTATPTPKPTATPEPTAKPVPTTTPAPDSKAEGIRMNDFSNYGLQVGPDGTILLNGDPFYGFGVNWHGAFCRSYGITPRNVTSMNLFESYFKQLAEDKIPCVRIMMGVFYPNEVSNYINYHDKFIRSFDQVVKFAEKYNIGIIASLMWNDGTFYAYCGEDLKSLGNPEAKGTKLAVQYVSDIVARYRYSPAIWVWEVGNEGNLGVDLWPEHGVQHSTQQLSDYYKTVAAAIRALDPYRIICGGDSAPRPGAYKLRHYHIWGVEDNLSQMKETFELYAPGDMDTVSLHIYEYNDADRMETMFDAAKALKKGLYVGEFGAGSYTSPDGDTKEEIDCWNHVVDKLLEMNCQVCLEWCWGRCIEISDYTSIEEGLYKDLHQNEYMMDRIKEINAEFVRTGKNKSAEYWQNVVPAFES